MLSLILRHLDYSDAKKNYFNHRLTIGKSINLPLVSILSPDAPLRMFFDFFDEQSVNVDKLFEVIGGC